MADERNPNRGVESEDETPRWVKVSWIVGGVVLILVLVVLLVGGDHGPSRHLAPATSEHSSMTGESP